MEADAKTLRDSIALRWIVLVLLSALMFATYWFQHFFSGLKGLMESELGFTSEEFGRLIGLTTIANMFGMIIVGGIVLDKWGIKLAGLVFGGLAAVGCKVGVRRNKVERRERRGENRAAVADPWPPPRAA